MANNRNLQPFFWFALPVVVGMFVLYALLSSTFPTISGKTGNGDSRGSSMSADGRLIAYISNDSHNPGGSNGRQNVYVYDNETGNTILASTNSAGEPADGSSGNMGLDYPKLSADGETIIFTSTSSNLVPDVNGGLFKKNLKSGEITVVAAKDDARGSWDRVVVQDSSISADGRFVLVTSSQGLFIHDSQSERTIRADVDANGNELINAKPGYGSGASSISADGRIIAFDFVTSLPEKKNGRDTKADVYIKNMQTGQLILASVDEKGQPLENSKNPSISADGNLLVFESDATIQIKDLKNGKVERLDDGTAPSMSVNGRYVIYQRNETSYSNPTSCEKNSNCPNLFLHDLQTGERKRILIPSGWDTWSMLEHVAVGDDGIVVFTAGAPFDGIEPEKCIVDRISESGGPTERTCSSVFRKDPVSGLLMMVSGTGGSTIEPVEQGHTREYYEEAVQNELRNAAEAEESYRTANEMYTYKIDDLRGQGFSPTKGISLNVADTDNYDFCIEAESNSVFDGGMWSFSKTGTPMIKAGTC